MKTQSKRNDNLRTASITIDNDNEIREKKSKLFFPRLFSDCSLEETGRKTVIPSYEEDCFEKLKNIRSNIVNLRQKVSSYSKLYENLSFQIENGITNLPKEESLLLNENKKLKEENLFYQSENIKLKNKISELEKENQNMISKYKEKYLKEMKELEKIFNESLNDKNKEIDSLKKKQENLLNKIEYIKETFSKEKEYLIKNNEEIINSNLELQRQIGNLFYNKWNKKLSKFKKFNLKKKNNSRKRSDDLETVIEEDKSDSVINGDLKKSLSSSNSNICSDINQKL